MAEQFAILSATYLLIDGGFLLVYGGFARLLSGFFGNQTTARLNRVSGTLLIFAAVLLGLNDMDSRAG